jgi:carboxypeptidase D
MQHILPRVIEATNRTLIGGGDYDFEVLTNGTLLNIQNMTWNGSLGFQRAQPQPITIRGTDLFYKDVLSKNNAPVGRQGTTGIQHFERGLMWVETFQSGHMQPQAQPRTCYRHLQWLLRYTEEI